MSSGGPQLDFRAFSVCMIIFPTIAIVLRFWSRFLSMSTGGPKLWWDDWMALAALPFTVAACALHLYAGSIGLGSHISTLTGSQVTEILKVLWASYFMSDIGVTLPKASVLFFYVRIFTTQNKWFRRAVYLAHALNIGWWLSAIARCLLFCDPVHKYWDTKTPGFCRPSNSLYIGSAVPSVAIDLIILLLPLPVISTLSLKFSRKILVSGVFVCGYLVIAISLGRMITSLMLGPALEEDFTYNVTPLVFWVDAEPPVSIIGCSLPTLFYLARRSMKYGTGSLFSSKPKSRLSSKYNVPASPQQSPKRHRRLNSTDNSDTIELSKSRNEDYA